jgi:uncharacterized membrane protein YqiK
MSADQAAEQARLAAEARQAAEAAAERSRLAAEALQRAAAAQAKLPR